MSFEIMFAILNLVALWSSASAASPRLNIDTQTIVMDTRLSPIGNTGNVHTGCLGTAVKITARDHKYCYFDYHTDGCGGILVQFRGKVPVTLGLVIVESRNGSIIKSFPDHRLQVSFRSGPPSK